MFLVCNALLFNSFSSVLMICITFSFTFDGHFVALHGGQHLVQLLLTRHVLHLTEVKFLKLHRYISTLQWERDGNCALIKHSQ